MGSFWVDFDPFLGHFWVPFWVILGPILTGFGSFWGSFLGSLFGSYLTPWEGPQGVKYDPFEGFWAISNPQAKVTLEVQNDPNMVIFGVPSQGTPKSGHFGLFGHFGSFGVIYGWRGHI